LPQFLFVCALSTSFIEIVPSTTLKYTYTHVCVRSSIATSSALSYLFIRSQRYVSVKRAHIDNDALFSATAFRTRDNNEEYNVGTHTDMLSLFHFCKIHSVSDDNDGKLVEMF
jgi:hypothetical protein